jgi:hypothetical protein
MAGNAGVHLPLSAERRFAATEMSAPGERYFGGRAAMG